MENSLLHVKDDGFKEDRQVLHRRHGGEVISLLRSVAVPLFRVTRNLRSTKEPRIGRAQRLAAQPITLLSISS